MVSMDRDGHEHQRSMYLSRRCRLAVICGLSFLLLSTGGCKRQEDADAAASQMAVTAQTLSAYYVALDHILAKTQDSYQAQQSIDGAPPLDLSDMRQQIELREQMATEIGELASLFQDLAGSSAATDASAAVGRFNSELVSVKALANNDKETKAVTLGVQEIVSLIQQREETKAARKVEPLCHNLSVFFESERSEYDSLNEAYLVTAQSVAKALVRNNQVDVSQVFLSALQPFGLSPVINQKVIGPGMQTYLNDEISASYKNQLANSQKATGSLSAALKEMDARISLVANDKTMNLRIPPLSLNTVEVWINQVTK